MGSIVLAFISIEPKVGLCANPYTHQIAELTPSDV